MRGNYENRWPAQQGRQANNSDAGGRQRGPATPAPDPSHTAYAANATQHRQAGAKTGLSSIAGNAWVRGQRLSQGESNMADDQHVPVRGFNAREAAEALRRGHQEAAHAADGINTAYRAPGRDANSAKPAGPWATKPNHMASGQDFFVQLRKAMATLQQGGSNASSGANST